MNSEARSVIDRVVRELLEKPESDAMTLGSVLKTVGKELGVSGKRLYGPVRAALTGMTSGPELDGIVAFIGVELTRRRLERALGLTGT